MFHGPFCDLYIMITYLCIKQKYSNTDLEFDYHDNGQSFEACESALLQLLKTSLIKEQNQMLSIWKHPTVRPPSIRA